MNVSEVPADLMFCSGPFMATALQITCGNESIKATTGFSYSNTSLGQGRMLMLHATNQCLVRESELMLNMSRYLTG